MRTGEERPSAAPVRDRILDEVCIRRQRTKNQPRQAPFEHSRSKAYLAQCLPQRNDLCGR